MVLNRMASKLFVKNYVEFVLKNEFDKKVKNQDDFEFKFGIIEEIDFAKDKIFNAFGLGITYTALGHLHRA